MIASAPVVQVLIWSGVLVAVVVVLTLGVLALRARLFAEEEPDRSGLTLASLREMRARGELSDEEFERAREVIVRQARAGIERGEDPAAALRAARGRAAGGGAHADPDAGAPGEGGGDADANER